MKTVSNLIVQTLCNTIDNLELIYLFGSRATGQAIAPSDWDIAFKAHAKLPPLKRWEAEETIANALKREVDLIDLLDASAVRKGKLGVPQSARESFDMLVANGYLSTDIANSIKSMVGLRNIAIHSYQQLNLDILIAVIENHLSDFDRFCAAFVD